MRKVISILIFLLIIGSAIGIICTSSSHGVEKINLKPSDSAIQMSYPEMNAEELSAHAAIMMSGGFIENQGQISNDEVLYYLTSSQGGIAFVKNGILINLVGSEDMLSSERSSDAELLGKAHFKETANEDERTAQGYSLRLSFVDSNPVEPAGLKRLSWYSNFFLGNDSSKWYQHVPSYQEVIYHNLWAGIDLVYRINNGNLKYDFIIHPGANPDQIEIKVEGDNEISIDREDTLNIHTSSGAVIKDSGLRVFYNSTKGTIKGEFRIKDNNIYAFALSKYDNTKTVIIDPFVYSTFLGGADIDDSWDIAVDSNRYAYVTGSTGSAEFPNTTGAYDTTYNNSDIFITKLNLPGTSLVYSTFIGGTSGDIGASITVDSIGNAYITGFTLSSDFPNTTNAYDGTLNGTEDAFIAKLNPTGSDLVYSTFLGGSGVDVGFSIDVDIFGNAYVTGSTWSPDFPNTTGAFDNYYNSGSDVFVTKLNPAGTDLIYSTFLGESGYECGWGIVVDSDEYVYVTGETNSDGFPTNVNAYDRTFNGSSDVFMTKFNPDGSDYIYSTFLGGNGIDSGFGIKVDIAGNAYITGSAGPGFPNTTGAYDTTYNSGSDAFVTKLNPSGTNLVYSTYIGGMSAESGKDIDIDSNGYVYITGSTQSADFPNTTGSFDNEYNGLGDSFISKLIPSATDLVYSTFIGGTNTDEGLGIAVDSNGYAYITGSTWSNDFPNTTGAFDNSSNGNRDVFVSKLDLTTVPLRPQNLQAVASDTKVDLSWEAPSDDGGSPIANYTIYRGTTSGGETFQALIGDVLTYADINVTNGQMYYYKVSAINAVGEGPNSTEVNAKPLGLPSEPRDLQVSYGDSFVRLIWTEPNSNGGSIITNYSIYRGPTSDSVTFLVRIGDDLTYVDSDLTNGQVYYYRIKAMNEVGDSPLSNAAFGQPRTTPSNPANLTISSGDEEITVTWDSPDSNGGSEIISYRIYRGTSSGDLSFLIELGSEAFTYTDSGLANGITYYYQVSAVNAAGEGPNTTEVSEMPKSLPQEKGFLEEFWWMLLLISMIVIIALVAILLMRRKKMEEDVGDGFKATAEPEGKVDTVPQGLVVPKIKEIAREKPKGKMPSPETVKTAYAIEMKTKSPATPRKVVKKPMQKVYMKKKVVRELAKDKAAKKPVKERKENN
jgi:fibronectin type 3 domain-containing protein